jgi:flavorubredoxin
MERMRAEEDAILHSYGWVDKAHGKVRVPIEHAIVLMLEDGLPQRQNPTNSNNSARDQLTSFAADSASGRFIERRPAWMQK